MNRTNPSLPNFSFMNTLSKIFVLLLLALLSISCSSDRAQQLPTTKLDLYQEKAFLWLPQQPLPAEQELILRLVLPDGVQPQLSYVEGENMAMGRIPVVWQQTENQQWYARLYLGACTEPTMEWRLTIPLLQKEKVLPERLTVTFSST